MVRVWEHRLLLVVFYIWIFAFYEILYIVASGELIGAQIGARELF